MASKLHKSGDSLFFWCPGCRRAHPFRIEGDRITGGGPWSWNGSMETPTFQPSLKILGDKQCHCVITNGTINFCTDSWHDLAGKSVPMIDWEEDMFTKGW